MAYGHVLVFYWIPELTEEYLYELRKSPQLSSWAKQR